MLELANRHGIDRVPGDATRFRTASPNEARARTQELLECGHAMAVLDRSAPFLAQVAHTSMNGLGLMSASYGAPVEIVCTPPLPWVTVSLTPRGGMSVTHADTGTESTSGALASVLTYDRTVRIRMPEGTDHLMLTIDRRKVERFLRRLLGDRLTVPLRFATVLDTDGAGRGFTAALSAVYRALATFDRGGPPAVLAAELEHSVISALLFGQWHNYSETLFSDAPLPSARLVRRVVEYIESTADSALTLADLAEFAEVSERSLHAAFRRQLGTSPMAYVRDRRLERAHEELLRSEPGGANTVTSVAVRLGFGNGGRFAAAYRERFGESPSDTLRR